MLQNKDKYKEDKGARVRVLTCVCSGHHAGSYSDTDGLFYFESPDLPALVVYTAENAANAFN